MGHAFAGIAFTPSVKAQQERHGSRAGYARLEEGPPSHDAIGPAEAAFVAARDGFYLATVSESGWPYVQFRGGPPGFLRVLDERTLGWADFGGNRQYLSVGNAARDDRAALFLMDYAGRRRLKLLGRLAVRPIGEDPALAGRLAVPGYRAEIERAVVFRLAALDWNCPRHIPRRFTPAEIGAATAPLRARLAELEAELARLRGSGDAAGAAGP